MLLHKNATQKYIEEHEYVFSLNRKGPYFSAEKHVTGWSVRKLILYHIKSFVSCVKVFPVEIYKGRGVLLKTWRMRNSASTKRAIVIGNGPSQGLLTVKELDSFVNSGGETYCVNYWHQNQNLSVHVPTWMVLSDPSTFLQESSLVEGLILYLKTHSKIKLIAPVSFVDILRRLGISNELHCFIDVELSIWNGIHPLLPRGYVSMTLYKALAWAVHMGYKEIGVIGMDNTYPRNIFNDENNHVCNLETHAGINDYLYDHSGSYSCVAAVLDELTRLFLNLQFFPNERVKNLDMYSLTDRFKKVSKDIFFGADAC
jgi:hypothetical protein